ncbi:MAG: zinc ribbon domain-containing protein [Clostridia bacterium]|nr:zinc ribbon domain-containing protein [Clostridia bacterium]
MRSVKPGRGPSFMGGVMCLLIGLFGVAWTAVAAGMGGGPFALFGILFIAAAVLMAIYNFKNATGRNRYSVYDITEHGEEPDPLNERFGRPQSTASKQEDAENKFCPYCGTRVAEDYEFCNNCGKKLP